MRATVVVAAMCLSVVGLSTAADVQAAIRKSTSIPAQGLGPALQTLAKERNFQLVYRPEFVRDQQTSGAAGELSWDEALTELLRGTGLTYRYLDERTVTIVPFAGSSSEGATSVAPLGGQSSARSVGGEIPAAAKEKKSIWQRLRLAQAETSSRSEEQKVSEGPSETSQKRIELEEIIVTGTHIRGAYPSSSPVEIYTAEDIARTGATTTEQFIQKLPQNMGTRTQYAAGSVGTGATTLNLDSVAGADLRGLGIGSTLVLLNGRRLGMSDFGRTVDISLIPVSAIDRVDVLTDGASAIYGSDAIGGVVNFLLRKDFDGADTRFSHGRVTDGGLQQTSFAQTFGRAWGSGNGLLSYNFFDASPLDVADRSYAAAAERGTLTPDDRRHSVLATFSQEIGERLLASADLAFAWRDVRAESSEVSPADPLNHNVAIARSETEHSFANLAFEYAISDRLNASVTATHSEADLDSGFVTFRYNQTPPTFGTPQDRDKDHSLFDVTAMLDGALFNLPSGDVLFSLGAGSLQEEYAGSNTNAVVTAGTLGRRADYVFAEFFLPLIGAKQDVSLVNRLELTLAGRYTRYEDASTPALKREFGDGTDPKIGLLWAPFSALSLRATYGTSFRAPSLVQIDETSAANYLSSGVPVPFPGGPPSTFISADGYAVPDLGPETAETYTIGFEFRPDGDPAFRLRGTYYKISYDDRIAQAPRGGVGFIQTPELYPSAIYRPPSAEFIENILSTTTNLVNTIGLDLSDPHAAAVTLFNSPNAWVVDLRQQNLARSEQDGFDLSVDKEFDTAWGEIRLGASMTRILSYRQQASAGSIVTSNLDIVAQPVDLRGRFYAGLSAGGFDGTLSANYVDDYANPFATGGTEPVGDFTTIDLNLSYAFGESTSEFFDGVRMNLSVQNVFDLDPPFVQGGNVLGLSQPIGFDPTNANPLGRVVVFEIAKSW